MTEEDTTCPGCGRTDFASVGSMRQHYAHTKDEYHEGSIAYEVVECDICGSDFKGLKSRRRRFCKEECRNKMSNGKRNPNYGNRGEDAFFGGHSHDDEWKDLMSNLLSGRNFTEEWGNKISEANSGEDGYWYGVRGEDHPAWNEESYNKRFSFLYYENRSKALERDGYECRVCSMSREEHYDEQDRDLHVHHIVPRGSFMTDDMVRPPDEAAELSNLFTVCSGCHRKVENNLIEIPENGNQMSGMDW